MGAETTVAVVRALTGSTRNTDVQDDDRRRKFRRDAERGHRRGRKGLFMSGLFRIKVSINPLSFGAEGYPCTLATRRPSPPAQGFIHTALIA